MLRWEMSAAQTRLPPLIASIVGFATAVLARAVGRTSFQKRPSIVMNAFGDTRADGGAFALTSSGWLRRAQA